jgi:hypothetical protein
MSLDEILHNDKVDTITFDVPALIRILEWTLEDCPNDVQLHKMVTNLLTFKNNTITMNQYDSIVKV